MASPLADVPSKLGSRMIKLIILLLFVAAVAGILGYARLAGMALTGAKFLGVLLIIGILFLILLITLFG